MSGAARPASAADPAPPDAPPPGAASSADAPPPGAARSADAPPLGAARSADALPDDAPSSADAPPDDAACLADAPSPGATSSADAPPLGAGADGDPPRSWPRALEALRSRRYELVLGFVVAGLLAGPRAPALVVGLMALGLAVGGPRRAGLGVGLAGAALAGACAADLRLASLDRSALGPSLGHAAVGDVTVLEPLRRQGFGRRAAASWRGERVLLRAGRHVRVPRAGPGDVLHVRGGLRAPAVGDGWLRRRSIHAILEADAVRRTGRRRGGVRGAVDAVRRRAEAALAGGVPPPQAALLRGMALGQDEALAPATREDFRRSGLAHLLAASGQNVLLLSALALGLAAVAGVPLRLRLWLVLGLVALYVPLAGAGPSIQRAGVMGAAGVVALLAGRPAARVHALLLAAAVTLVLDPRAAEDAGWQMSFAAVAAILALARPLAARLEAARIPPAIAAAVALTAAATAGTAPLIALHFGRASLVALPANVAAAPAVAPAMWLGMVAAAVGQLWPAAARVPAALAAYPAAYLSWLAHAAARAPLAEVGASPLEVTAVAAALAVAVGASRRRAAGALARAVGASPRPAAAALAGAVGASPRAPASRRKLLGLALLAAVAGTAIAVGSPRGGDAAPAGTRISILDVGQGDATLVQHGATAILVDAGEAGSGVVARLREAGVRRLEALVVTHAQADHAGGAAAVLDALDVGVVLDGRDGVRDPTGSAMAAAARRHGVRLVPALAGLRVRAGPLDLRVLWPEPRAHGSPPAGDPNLRAVVAELRAGGVSMLLAADAESEVLAQLDLRPVDVLKVAHHGSADEGLPAVLAGLRPRIATISAGAHNRFGHPAPSTLRALRAAGVAVVRTDRHGTVRLTPAGGTLRVERRA